MTDPPSPKTRRHDPGADVDLDGDCAVEGCGRLAVTRGWCHLHYGRIKQGRPLGPADYVLERQTGGCSVPGCTRPARTRGYCKAHYDRVVRTGEPGSATIRSRKTPSQVLRRGL